MKLLINITLVVALMKQLSLADDNAVKAVQPPNDKLYPIFDLIATRMSEHQKKEISLMGVIYTEILQEYNQYLVTHNTQTNQDYKTAIEKFLRSVELSEQHPENCNLQRAVDIRSVITAQPRDRAVVAIVIKGRLASIMYMEEYKRFVTGFMAQFPDLIKNFITSLDESEQQQYADLYKLGQEFLKASDNQQQLRTFQDFMVQIKFTQNTVSGNEENCKWDVAKFKRFLDIIQFNTSFVKERKIF